MDDDSLQKVVEELAKVGDYGREHPIGGVATELARRLSTLRERLLKEAESMTLDSTGGPLVTAAILRQVAGGQPE